MKESTTHEISKNHYYMIMISMLMKNTQHMLTTHKNYMHWHYRINHPTQTVMIKMREQGMLPRRITKILATMI
jgi:hypothetical protein